MVFTVLSTGHRPPAFTTTATRVINVLDWSYSDDVLNSQRISPSMLTFNLDESVRFFFFFSFSNLPRKTQKETYVTEFHVTRGRQTFQNVTGEFFYISMMKSLCHNSNNGSTHTHTTRESLINCRGFLFSYFYYRLNVAVDVFSRQREKL